MKKNNNKLTLPALLVIGLLFSFVAQAALTQAGTLIKNQASASYKDAAGIKQFVTSNIVETLIQQVASVELVQDQTKFGAASQVVLFPHVLKNTGNDVDTFNLTTANLAGDNFDLSSFKIYADNNKDGLPDNTDVITVSDALGAEEEFYFVVEATLPAAVVEGDLGNFTITATSIFDNTVIQLNTDTVKATDKAIIDVTKSMSGSTGPSPSGPITVTLRYINKGIQTATDVTLIDALPAGMTYVPGSAEWSELVGTVLTDNDKTDDQSGVIYCAYHADCISLPTDTVSTEQVTMIIASVDAGASGTLTFDVMIDSGLDAGSIYNAAAYEYENDNGNGTVTARIPTNKVPFEVLTRPIVIANGSDDDLDPDNADNLGGTTDSFIIDIASPGEVLFFDNIIRNKGNSVDTFDITVDNSVTNPFPAGTVFSLYKEDGRTPLLDSNSNGVIDTGPIASGGQYKVVLRVVLPYNAPVGDNAGNGYNIEKTATSSLDASVSDTVTDHLNEITAITVDLTNDAAVGDAGVKGVGPGPEATPVTTLSVAPGGQGVFKLFVNNTSNVPGEFLVGYTSNLLSPDGTLYAGWKAALHFDGGNGDCSTLGAVTGTTGAMPANSSRLICAVISVPTDAVAAVDASGNPVVNSIFFKVDSPLSNTGDFKHDAIIVVKDAAIAVEPNQQGQVQPGNTITYSHRITNTGNSNLECITLDTTNNVAGWNSIVYLDANNSGQLDDGDVRLTDQVLAAGETFSVIVKLYSPANAPLGTKNTTTLTLLANEDDGDGDPAVCTGNQLTSTANDVTTANASEVSILKAQSLDADCDGVSDSGVFLTTTFQVNPANCIIYRLTATNQGAATVQNVRIDDASPSFTSYSNAGGLPTVTQGNIQGGIAGTEGTITGGSIGGASVSLSPGNSIVLTFSVQLD